MTTSKTKSIVSSEDPVNPGPVLPTMLINIQFLRFVAAMLVVAYHSSIHLKTTGVEQGLFFSTSEAVGFAGVDIFFVISGFIMAYTTTNATGLEQGIDFFKRRLARIYSGYWPFYLVALVLFAWIGGSYLAEASLWRSLILWPAPHPLITVSWTLIYEMYFYILFALLIGFTGPLRKPLLKIMLWGIVAWAIYSQFVRHAYDHGQLETLSLAEAFMFSPYLMEFLAGSLLAGWLSNKPMGHSWSWLLPGIALFLAGGWVNNTYFGGEIEQGYYIFWRVLVFGTASLMIVTGLVRLEHSDKTAALRFSLAAGGASYAIYLSHILWLTATQHLGLNDFLGQFTAWIAQTTFLFYGVFILYYSIMHYRIIERPLHRLFKKWLGI